MRTGVFGTAFWHQFFRNVGLGVFNDLCTWVRGFRYRSCQNRAEQKKVVVSSSRWLAVSRCGVHILPVLVSTAIIALNLKQDFIGIDFRSLIHYESVNIALLQTAAKVQELLIVATILFHLTRDELLYGEGIPLGMVGAGLDFSKLSYFWSRELIGSLQGLSKGPRKYRKAQLVIFLLLAGLFSLLAGPSCAVLMVPQTQNWPIGGTPISLNGTADSFWPVNLTLNSSQSAICLSLDGTLSGVCPSGGYESLWSHYHKLDSSNYADHVPVYAYSLSGNHYYWSVGSMRPVMTQTISLGSSRPTVWMVQPHLSSSIVLEQLMKDWWRALLASRSYQDSQIIDRQAASSHVLNPIVRVNCAPPNLLSSANHTVLFPVVDCDGYSQSVHAQEITGSPVSDKPTNHLQFSWINLNKSFGCVTTGAVLQSAWNSDNKSRFVVGCSVTAHWVPAQIRSDSYTFWQGWYPKDIKFGSQYPTNGAQLKNGSLSTHDAIVVDESWLNSLTPATPPSGPGYLDWKPTTIESILSATRITEEIENNGTIMIDTWQTEDNTNRPGLLASVIASIFLDGLSRAGVGQLYKAQESPSQLILSPYEKEANFDHLILNNKRALKYPSDEDMFSVEFGISGLNYSTSLAQQLAMIVLFLYIAVAVSYSVWLITRSKSSACWDSTIEILAIAQNSKPAFRALANTAAGIQHLSTFSKKVVVRPTKLPDGQEADHLQFQLSEEDVGAESEMMDLEPQRSESTQAANSSVVGLDEQSPETVNLIRPTTWPIRERQSKSSSSPFTHLPHSRKSSVSRRSLMGPLCEASGTSQESPFKEDLAYG